MRVAAWICVASLVGWGSVAHALQFIPEPTVERLTPDGGTVPSNVVLLVEPRDGLDPWEVTLFKDEIESETAFSVAYCSARLSGRCLFRLSLDLAEGSHDFRVLDPNAELFFTLESNGQVDEERPSIPSMRIVDGEVTRTQNGVTSFWTKSVSLTRVSAVDENGIAIFVLYRIQDGRRRVWDTRMLQLGATMPVQMRLSIIDEGEGEVEFHLISIDIAGNESEPNIFFIDTDLSEAKGLVCTAAHAARNSGLPQPFAALLFPLVMLFRRRRRSPAVGG